MSVSQEERVQRSQFAAVLQGFAAIVVSVLMYQALNASGFEQLFYVPAVAVLAVVVHLVLSLIGLARRHLINYHVLPPLAIYLIVAALFSMTTLGSALIVTDEEAGLGAANAEFERNPAVDLEFMNLGVNPLGLEGRGILPEPMAGMGRNVVPSQDTITWESGRYTRPIFHYQGGVSLLKEGLWNDEAKSIEVCELQTSGVCRYRSWPVSRILTPELDALLPLPSSPGYYRSEYQLFFLDGRVEVVRSLPEHSVPEQATSVIVRNFTGSMITRVMLGDYLATSGPNNVLMPAQGGVCGDEYGTTRNMSYPGGLPARLRLSWRDSANPESLRTSTLAVPGISEALAAAMQKKTESGNYWEVLLYPQHTVIRLVNDKARSAQCEAAEQYQPCWCQSELPEIVAVLRQGRLPLAMPPKELAAAIKEGEAASASAADAPEQPQ
ncbi:hypothetical protein [Chitinilyticum piscinae]|uniref:Uncharacterized protein n=1 Tax=Chitinilyticum piscinae TaxID=2866724 RepID=A0A8J7K2I7_9NEIS|nr:hypothetical protein [Chitinilyticum piscinae]MBE9610526.1 hypothetical protein [Chitinilyticum piscinae]